jgi:hypothetical protein
VPSTHKEFDSFYVALLNLEAHNDTERTLKAQSVSMILDMAQVRSLMQSESTTSISKSMLTALVLWLVLIFLGFSLIAPPNATANITLIPSALCAAGAIFLILELDRPFSGIMRISSEPIRTGWVSLGNKTINRQKNTAMRYLTNLTNAAILCALTMLGTTVQGQPPSSPDQNAVTAIDILLEPDTAMLRHAEADNARLLKVYPKGFALDATHTPHITMLQCFVRTADLDKVYAAQEKVFATANLKAMKLEAFKYYYAPADATTGVAGICAKPSQEIVKLQADVIAAAKPFMQETATAMAFTAPHEDPATDAAFIKYISTFVPKMTGEHFNPHVSIGVAPKDYLDKILNEPFEPFTFSPAGAAVFQLGPYGTAAKKLKEWDLKP